MTARRVICVDTETTGLDPARHACVEVAWWDLSTGQRGHFIPKHNPNKVLATADLQALKINRYIDRIALGGQDYDGVEMRRLADALEDQTLAGSNPRFDLAFLNRMFMDHIDRELLEDVPTVHHRLWDLSAYAAGVLGLDHLPGLAEVCELLGVDARPDHSAETDVTATGECFLALFKQAGVRL